MKIYVSADIEGTTGIAHRDEIIKGKTDYAEFQKQMTAEVAAACEGALDAGASEIVVKDAHDTARNIIVAKLPEKVRIIREWSQHPYSMLQGLDESFDAVIMTGYHAKAGTDTNPLAHTITGSLSFIKVNGKYISEFLLGAYTAALVGVPVVLVTGDKGLCREVSEMNPEISTVAVSEGVGASTFAIHPNVAVRTIKEVAKKVLSGDFSKCRINLPGHFEVEVGYKEHKKAYKMSFYPGARLVEPHVIRFESDDYFEVLRTLMFTL